MPSSERIGDAGDDARREGVLIAQELLEKMAGLIQGAYIIPGGDYDHDGGSGRLAEARGIGPRGDG